MDCRRSCHGPTLIDNNILLSDARLRFGIGSDFPRGGQIDYVLGHFTDEDWKTMDERLEVAGEIIKSFCLAGIDITMNQFNKK